MWTGIYTDQKAFHNCPVSYIILDVTIHLEVLAFSVPPCYLEPFCWTVLGVELIGCFSDKMHPQLIFVKAKLWFRVSSSLRVSDAKTEASGSLATTFNDCESS